ncbi:MAG: molybdenum cofactor biosynthesis protein MoaE [Nitrososphaerales archaeon]|nr:molybdenum cofactor biosynthesis protein MoaE [Nitrososphaerales archaeon]
MRRTVGRITRKQIDPSAEFDLVTDPSAGGIVLFAGTIRNRSEHGRVSGLEYEVYKEMAEKRLRVIEAEVRKRWPVRKIRMVHREGKLKVGEVSVVVAVSCAHRADAFEACRYAIDRIKTGLPLWKKEMVGGTSRWVAGKPIDSE